MKKYIFLALLVCLIPSQAKSYPNGPYAAVQKVRNVYSSTNVTTGAWVQLVSSMTSEATMMEIFDSSGQTLQIGIGKSGSEVAKFYVVPGGNGQINFSTHIGDRVSIEAVSGTANAGELDITFYQGQ